MALSTTRLVLSSSSAKVRLEVAEIKRTSGIRSLYFYLVGALVQGLDCRRTIISDVGNARCYWRSIRVLRRSFPSIACHRRRPVANASAKGLNIGLTRGPPVREVWTNRGRVLHRLGEPNAGRGYGSHRLTAVPQSALHGGSSQSHDLLRAFWTAYRIDSHARRATFRNVAYSILKGQRSHPPQSDTAVL